ncbi:MAG: penicillin-binding protein 2 [SAR86 cluster bacterium]|nr:penicillin-binding protein 2 [SAR86 cluster bacterium]
MSSHRLVLFEGRSLSLRIFFITLLTLLFIRLIYVQVYDSNFLDRTSENRITAKYSINAPRGSILDRNGKYLALDVESYTLQVDLENFDPTPKKISSVLHILREDEKNFANKIRNKKGFIQVKRHLTLKEKIEIERLGIKGISLLRDLKRSYPQGEISAHAVGITDIDRNGLQGAEKLFDNYMKSTSGSFNGSKDRVGNKLYGIRVEPERGRNINMTLDIRIQSIAYNELRSSVLNHGAKSGSIILVDPISSEILAMANYPSFEPSNRKELSDFSLLRNRSAIDLFQPGSVIKPIAMAAVIDFNNYDVSKIIDTSPGWIDFGGYRTEDYRDYGELTLSEIIARSSNVGMVKLCSKVEKGFIYEYLGKFGIGSYPASILINTREGFLSYTDAVTPRDKVSACYGYGMSVTSIHLAQAYSILASNGIYKELTLFKNNEEMPYFIESKRVISEETVNFINETLYQAVNSNFGTAKRARIKAISVSGKTGTVENIENNKQVYSAIFAGFAPSKKPKIVAIVSLHGLEGEIHSGSSVAAPLFSRVMEQSLHTINSGI